MVQGALELIGVRAVIVDFRTYLNQGRQMEAATNAIAKATLNVESAANKTITAQQRLDQVNNRIITGNVRLTASYNDLTAAKARLNTAQRVAASPQVQNLGIVGQTAAANDVAAAEHALEVAQLENALAKASIPTIGAQTAARNAAAATAERESLAVTKLGEAEAKEQGLAASRAKLITGTAAVAGGAGFLLAGAASVAAASKYQDTLAKISILTNATQADTDKLGKSFLELSKTVPSSPNELGAAAYFVLSSGIQDTNTALEVTKLSAKDAAIGLGSATDAAKNLTQILAAYGSENITAGQANDILIAAIKEGRAEAQDFAGSLGRVLPIANAIGVKFDQVAASMAILTNGGLSADEAATGLRAILNDLTKSSPAADKALHAVGTSANEVRQAIKEKGLAAEMLNLIQLFKGNLAAIEPIIPNIRGLVAASSEFISQGGKVGEVLDRITNSGGSTDKAFTQASKTFSFQAGLLKNEFNVALIELGTAILPQVTSAVAGLTKWIEDNRVSVQNLMTTGFKVFIEMLKDLAAGIGVVVDALSWLPKNETTVAAAVIAIGAAFAWALPGSPYVKGLIFILTLLGQLQKGIDLPGVGKAGGNTARTAVEVGGGILTGGLATVVGGPVAGAIAGPVGFAATTGLINKFFGEVGDDAKDTKTKVDPLDAAMERFNKVTLPDLARNTSGVDEVDKQLAKDLKQVAGEFKSTSQAAGDVESFTKSLKLFGEVNKDVADAFKLDARGAGAVQAADAIEASIDRVEKTHFEYVKTLGTIASLISQGAIDVARETVLGIARNALKGSQQALSSVLGGTTRDVANLNVPLAQSRLKEAQINQRVDPQLYDLKQDGDNIDKQLKAIDKRQTEEDKKRKTRDDALKLANDRQNTILQNQLDVLKYANDLAKNAYELQAEKLQDLIDANKKAISDLQTSFLKSNEDLQQQINQAIGAGNSAQALSLVTTQQNNTRGFRTANNVLNANGQGLTTAQTAADRAEKQREREAQLAQDALDKQKKLIDSQQKSIEEYNKQRDALRDLTLGTDRQKTSLQNQKDKIDAQVASLDHQKDVQGQVTQKLQDQISVYEAQTGILKAQGEAADQTLLTQQQQARTASDLITQIGYESTAIRDLTTGTDELNPLVHDAATNFQELKSAVEVLTNDSIRGTFTSTIDAMAKRDEILAAAEGKAGSAAGILGDNLTNTSGKVTDWITNLLKGTQNVIDQFGGSTARSQSSSSGNSRSALSSLLHSVTDPIGNFLSGASLPHGALGFAEGGFTGTRGGFVHPNEAVLPLGNPSRSREILGQLPAGFTASLNRGRNGPSSIFGNVNINGSTREELKALAHQAIDEAFSRSSRTAGNGGSLLSIGVGAGGF